MGVGRRLAATMRGSGKAEVATWKWAPKTNSPICWLGAHRVPQSEGAGSLAGAPRGVRGAAGPQLPGHRLLRPGRFRVPRPGTLTPGEVELEPGPRQPVSSGSQLQDAQQEAALLLPGARGSHCAPELPPECTAQEAGAARPLQQGKGALCKHVSLRGRLGRSSALPGSSGVGRRPRRSVKPSRRHPPKGRSPPRPKKCSDWGGNMPERCPSACPPVCRLSACHNYCVRGLFLVWATCCVAPSCHQLSIRVFQGNRLCSENWAPVWVCAAIIFHSH